MRERALDDHHADARRDARDEEEDREEWRVPERVELARRHQEEGAEGGLVERRERDAEDDDADRQRAEETAHFHEAEPFERGRRELESEDHQVQEDAPADLVHDGGRAGRQEELIGEAPRLAKVHDEPEQDEGVAEEAGQDRGAQDRPVGLLAEDVDGAGDRVAARRERDAADDVEGDPDAP
jgi:hypothetical protein